MTQIGKFLWAILAIASLSSACSSSSNGSTYVRPKGRGSAACQAWQKAICDYATLDCKSNLTEQDCVNEYYGITCLSDTTAQSCATALDSATCTVMPANCNLQDIADPAPAIAACNGFIETACNASVACGASTHDQCITEFQSALDCSTVNSLGLSYESCMSDVAKLSCNADLPASCQGIFIAIKST